MTEQVRVSIYCQHIGLLKLCCSPYAHDVSGEISELENGVFFLRQYTTPTHALSRARVSSWNSDREHLRFFIVFAHVDFVEAAGRIAGRRGDLARDELASISQRQQDWA